METEEMMSRTRRLLTLAVLMLILSSGCSGTAQDADHDRNQEPATTEEGGGESLNAIPLDSGEKLRVVATTNIVGDVVGQVGGDRIELTTLMDIGVDPHSYVPTPSDTAAIHDAHLILANGAGLEENLEEMFTSAGEKAVQIRVSNDLEYRSREGEGEGHEHGQGDEDVDPHVWFDVQNVIHWTETIRDTLSALDPANTDYYAQSAESYVDELAALDTWVQEQVDQIPEENRRLVTNHPVFGYFADRYGLEQLGTIYPISPSSEPSARDVAALEDAIRQYGVPAVFAESTVNPKLAEQVAQDTGIRVVPLYTGSLGEPGSGAETYILLIRYDVNAIVAALR